ncbi:RNA polymerase sigma factor [Patulibacter sp. NPDC049589]|uniref:RNA polymerase sigma factor n=1 Tax=Patulibacter sp. NPDC049589 TaxID=3154731 RepID=UPI00341751E7
MRSPQASRARELRPPGTRSGPPTDFEALYARYLPEIVRYMRRRLDDATADDAAAEVFVRVLRSRSGLVGDQPERAVRAWLYTIARNIIQDRRRSERRRLRAIARVAAEPTAADARAYEPVNPALVEGLRRLSAVERESLLLIAWGELSFREAATVTDVPLGTLHSRVASARRKLARLQVRPEPTWGEGTTSESRPSLAAPSGPLEPGGERDGGDHEDTRPPVGPYGEDDGSDEERDDDDLDHDGRDDERESHRDDHDDDLDGTGGPQADLDEVRALRDLGLDLDAAVEASRLDRVTAIVRRQSERPAPGSLGRMVRIPGRSSRRLWVAATLTGLVAAGGAAAATGLWSPSLGDDDRGRPSASASDVPADQLAAFAVLRRPATDADRGAAARAALRYVGGRFSGVRTDRVRAPAGAPGTVLVPVARSSTGAADALCLFAPDRAAGGGGISCWTTRQIREGHGSLVAVRLVTRDAVGGQERPADGAGGTDRATAEGAGAQPAVAGGRRIGLVPDGVAAVRGDDGTTAPVRDNAYVLELPAGAAVDAPVTLLDDTGRRVGAP